MSKRENKFDTKEFFDKLISGGEEPKVRPEKRSHIPFRLNFLFFVIFMLFVALIARLGYVQIIDAESIAQKVDRSTKVEIKEGTPRGMIYDAKGRVLADNVANASITYTRGNNISGQAILEIARKLAALIDVPADENLTDRSKKDYFLADNDRYEAVEARLADEEKTDADGIALSNSDYYKTILEKVTAEDLNFSPEELKVATIFTRMNAAEALNTVFIKNEGVTDEELAIVAENGRELSGISTGTDWSRKYTDEDTIRGILGSVSTQQEGIPEDKLDEYQEKGYLLNDRVGKSNLELQYEDYLQGTRTISEVKLDSQGNIESQVAKETGEKGSNLVLTIDTEFQKQVQEIVERNFNAVVGGAGLYSPGAYVTVMDVQSGAIYALAGVSHEPGTLNTEMNITGTYLNQFEPGSTIKAATIASGYENGALTGNDILVDQPIIVGNSTQSKSSWFNRSSTMSVSAAQALQYSSNSYMMQIAIRLMGKEYSRGMNFPYTTDQVDAYNKLRSTYAEFGLGTTTGLDLPNEATGLVRSDYEDIDAGKILDLSFGQFDTYTSVQLAQYMATIANGGKRVAAHVVEGVYGNDEEGNIDRDNLIKAVGPEVLDEVNISESQLAVIQEGLANVVYGSGDRTTGRDLSSASVKLHAKTGTAETVYVSETGYTVNTYNSNLVAYSNTGENDIAISVVLPQMTVDGSTSKTIALQVIEAYFASVRAGN